MHRLQARPVDVREGFEDGLGVRTLRTDGTGDSVQVLTLCHEVAAMRTAITDRVSRLSSLRLAQFVHVRWTSVPQEDSFGFEIVSDHVPGVRLSEIITAASAGQLVIGVDATWHIVRQTLGAVASLHQSRGVTHGAIGPERILITPRGHVVLTDHVFSLAFQRLALSRSRLWRVYRVPMPVKSGAPQFDAEADIAQVGAVALALLGNRLLQPVDYPGRLMNLVETTAAGPGVSSAQAAKFVKTWLKNVLQFESSKRSDSARDVQLALEDALSKDRRSPVPTSGNPVKVLFDDYQRAIVGADTEVDPARRVVQRRALSVAPKVTADPVPAAAATADDLALPDPVEAVEGRPIKLILKRKTRKALPSAADAILAAGANPNASSASHVMMSPAEAILATKSAAIHIGGDLQLDDVEEAPAPPTPTRPAVVEVTVSLEAALDEIAALPADEPGAATAAAQPLLAGGAAGSEAPEADLTVSLEAALDELTEPDGVETQDVYVLDDLAADAGLPVVEVVVAHAAPEPLIEAETPVLAEADVVLDGSPGATALTGGMDLETAAAAFAVPEDWDERRKPDWRPAPDLVAVPVYTLTENEAERRALLEDASVGLAQALEELGASAETEPVAAIETVSVLEAAPEADAVVMVDQVVEVEPAAAIEPIAAFEATAAAESPVIVDQVVEVEPAAAVEPIAAFEATAAAESPVIVDQVVEVEPAAAPEPIAAFEATAAAESPVIIDQVVEVEPVAAIEPIAAFEATAAADSPVIVDQVVEVAAAAAIEPIAAFEATAEPELLALVDEVVEVEPVAAIEPVAAFEATAEADAADSSGSFGDTVGDVAAREGMADDVDSVLLPPMLFPEREGDQRQVFDGASASLASALDVAAASAPAPVVEFPARPATDVPPVLFGQDEAIAFAGEAEPDAFLPAAAGAVDASLAAAEGTRLQDESLETLVSDTSSVVMTTEEYEEETAGPAGPSLAARVFSGCGRAAVAAASLAVQGARAFGSASLAVALRLGQATVVVAGAVVRGGALVARVSGRGFVAVTRASVLAAKVIGRAAAVGLVAVGAGAAAVARRTGAACATAARGVQARMAAAREARAERRAERARIAEERRIAEEEYLAELARIAEAQRLEEEARAAEAARIAEALRLEEEARAAEAARIAEAQRLEEEARAAEAARIAEALRLEEEARAAEAARIAEALRLEEQARAAEAARIAEAHRLEEEARAAEAARIAEAQRLEEEARAAEAARIAEAHRIAEAERLAEIARLAEAERLAEAARIAEAQRIAEAERLAELARLAEAARIAEAHRLEEEARAAEAARIAEAQRIAEAERLAELARLAEAARIAEAHRLEEEARAAEAARIAEAQRIAEAERLAELARLVEAARIAEAHRLEEEARAAEAARIAEALRIAESERLAEEERVAELALAAEAARVAEAERVAEAARIAEARRLAEEVRLVEAARVAEATCAAADVDSHADIAEEIPVDVVPSVGFFARLAFLRGTRLAPVGGAILLILLAIGIARPVWENARYAWRKVQLATTAATTAAKSAATNVAKSAMSHTADAVAAPVAVPASTPVHSTTGVVKIESQPVGAEVFLDGKRRGVTPLEVRSVKPGTHAVMIRAAEGSVSASVHVAAGEVADVLLPIFPGWVSPFAPAALQIFEGGVLVGSTEDGRIMMKPGVHQLELVSEPLGYRATQNVNVTPGEVAALNIALPTAPLEIEAPAGAEISINGKIIGLAPVETQQVSVGTCQVLMRHPTLGEQRQTTTVTYKTPNRIVFAQLD